MIPTWPPAEAVLFLAEPIIKNAEGFDARPYLCPAGIPTIGWGTTRYPNGRRVTLQDKPVSQAEAEIFLQASARRVLAQLQGIVARAPTVRQAAALLSLAYNIGVGAHDGRKGDLADSTLLECFDRGDLAGAAAHFLDWNKARIGGRLQALPGLTARRKAEQALFSAAA
ncbi:MAG TPA: lysozyme [Rhizomicrobium sp.]